MSQVSQPRVETVMAVQIETIDLEMDSDEVADEVIPQNNEK